MKKFLIHTTSFIGLLILIIAGILFVFNSFTFPNSALRLDASITKLIIGDSHTECALDDAVLTNTKNISQSADNYMYSYIKLKAFLKQNPQIETVIVSYSYFNLLEFQDEWYKKEKYINFKVPKYFQLVSLKELSDIFRVNPKSLLNTVPAIIKYNAKLRLNRNIKLKDLDFGAYQPLDVAESDSIPIVNNDNNEYSLLQKKYLKKIYDLCINQNKQVILIAPPVTAPDEFVSENTKRIYFEYHKSHLNNAILLDYSYYELDKKYYADPEHLNKYGAQIFSNYLLDII